MLSRLIEWLRERFRKQETHFETVGFTGKRLYYCVSCSPWHAYTPLQRPTILSDYLRLFVNSDACRRLWYPEYGQPEVEARFLLAMRSWMQERSLTGPVRVQVLFSAHRSPYVRARAWSEERELDVSHLWSLCREAQEWSRKIGLDNKLVDRGLLLVEAQLCLDSVHEQLLFEERVEGLVEDGSG